MLEKKPKKMSGKNPCDDCTICCEHVALPIDTPRSKEDWHHVLWYVMHNNILVYKDHEGTWFIEFETKCKALNDKGLCGIYSERPHICKEYSEDECEKFGEGNYYSVIFRNRKDVLEYVKNNTRIKNFQIR